MYYSSFRSKEVINVNDGHRLGKTKDLVFQCPEGKILGIIVPGSAGCHLFHSDDVYIDLKNIVKFGEEVILADVRCKPPEPSPYCTIPKKQDRRNYEEYE